MTLRCFNTCHDGNWKHNLLALFPSVSPLSSALAGTPKQSMPCLPTPCIGVSDAHHCWCTWCHHFAVMRVEDSCARSNSSVPHPHTSRHSPCTGCRIFCVVIYLDRTMPHLLTELDLSVPLHLFQVKPSRLKHAIQVYFKTIDCTQSLSSNVPRASCQGNRSAANLMLRDYRASLDDAVEAIRLGPNNPKFHVRAGKAYVCALVC